MQEFILKLTGEQIDLILFGLLNAPIAANTSIPLKNWIEKQATEQLVKKDE